MLSWLNPPSPTTLATVAFAVLCGVFTLSASAQPADVGLLPAPLPELEASPKGWEQIDQGVWRLQSADGTLQQYYAAGPEGMAWLRQRLKERAQELERAFLAGQGPTWDQILDYREIVDAFNADSDGLRNEALQSQTCFPYLRRATTSAAPLNPGATASASADWSSDGCTGRVQTYAWAQAGNLLDVDTCPPPPDDWEYGTDAFCWSSASKAGTGNCYSEAWAAVDSPVGGEGHISVNTICGSGGVCQESVQCPDGTTIACEGPTGTCSSGLDWVNCQGQVTECPSCTESLQCPDGSTLFCEGLPGTCSSGPTWIECDYQRENCPCYESVSCPDGSTISCSGPPFTCSSGSDWVNCNGTRTDCPEEQECTGNGDACTTSADCDCSCGPPGQCMGGTCLCVT